MTSKLLSATLVLLLTSLPVFGAEPQTETAPEREFLLTNGNKITGSIVAEKDDSLVIQNDLLGEITIPRSALAPEPNILTEVVVSPEVAESEATTLETDATALQVAEKKEVLPFLNIPENWEGKFSLGNAWQSGRSDKISTDVRAQLTTKYDSREYQYTGFYRFEETNDSVSSDRWGLGFRFRQDIDPTTFIQANTSYESDRIKEINHQLLQTIGYGFRLIDRKDFHVNLVPGIAIEYLDQKGRKKETNFLFNIYQDLVWNIDERFVFNQNFNFFFNPENNDQYRFLFKSGITGAITETVRMDISYEFEYDNNVSSNVNKHDSRLISAIVLAF